MSKTPVAILGATGAVGQRFIQLLADHPWFAVAEVVASDRSAGKPYREACTWRLPGGIPSGVADLMVKGIDAPLTSKVLFSGLDSSVAGEAETAYAARGHAVVSNSRNHRMDADVPLLIPEINASHLEALAVQRKRTGGGYIVTNPNCSVVGLAMALAPLHRAFGVESVGVVTLQALSGAGYPGVASLDIADNVLPFIGGGEEEKIESEPQKILGEYNGVGFKPARHPHLLLRAPRGRERRAHHGRVREARPQGQPGRGRPGLRELPGRAPGAGRSPRRRGSRSTSSPRRTAPSPSSIETARAAWR